MNPTILSFVHHYISLRVRQLVHLHFTPGIRRFLRCLFHYFQITGKYLDVKQSPWLIELVALYMNLKGSDSLASDELFGQPSYDLNIWNEESFLTLTLLVTKKLEYNLTCLICLVYMFDNKHINYRKFQLYLL